MTRSAKRNPASFDYRKYLQNKKIYYLATLFRSNQFEVLKPAKVSLYYRWLDYVLKYREYAKDILRANLGEKGSAVANAIFTGDTRTLTKKQNQNFIRAGLMHLFAVSGLHTTMIAFLIYFFFQIINLPRFLRSSFIIAALLFFIGISGFSPSAIRAVIMVTALLISDMLKRDIQFLDSLSFACFVTLIFNPRALWSPSFQLSYLAVFFIIIHSPTLRTAFAFRMQSNNYKKNRIIYLVNKFLLLPFLISFAVNLALLPFIVGYFYQFSLISPISNVIGIPVSFVVLSFTLLGVTIGGLIEGLQPLLLFPVKISSFLLNGIAEISGGIPFSSVSSEPLPFWGIAVFYLIIFTGKHLQTYINMDLVFVRRWRFIIHSLGAFTFFLLLKIAPISSPVLESTFLDVGKGDATYLEFPCGANMLVDAGDNEPFDYGENVITPFFWSKGIDHLDTLLITHPDKDHSGGAVSILKNFPVNRLIINKEFENSPEGTSILMLAKGLNIPILKVERGDFLTAGDVRMMVLNPGKYNNTFDPSNKNTNANSIVLRVSYGDIDLLLTGDADKNAELEMVLLGLPLESEILKIGHHGSNSSTNPFFLKKVNPQLAIISVSKNNPFHHPGKEVIARLNKEKINCFRTDENGAIIVDIDGKTFSVSPTVIGKN